MLRTIVLVSILSGIVSADNASVPLVAGPITSHFSSWLNSNGYADDAFDRLDYGTQGSFGGKLDANDRVNNTPVIFIHGNSDAALRVSAAFAGWEFSINYFLNRGYTSAELYATSYSDDNPLNAHLRSHNCKVVTRLRRFVEAVKNYTGAPMVHIISHSLGVTLGRKVVKGGQIKADDGTCNIGKPLRYVDVFVGLAGGNYGLCTCQGLGELTIDCNEQNGFWPGDSCGFNLYGCGSAILMYPCNGVTYSSYLMDLNSDIEPEGKRIVSAWSKADELIGNQDTVWGRPTSAIPRATDEKVYDDYSHMETKERSVEDQYNWVNRRS